MPGLALWKFVWDFCSVLEKYLQNETPQNNKCTICPMCKLRVLPMCKAAVLTSTWTLLNTFCNSAKDRMETIGIYGCMCTLSILGTSVVSMIFFAFQSLRPLLAALFASLKEFFRLCCKKKVMDLLCILCKWGRQVGCWYLSINFISCGRPFAQGPLGSCWMTWQKSSKSNMWQVSKLLIYWVVPLPSNSHHQHYYIFSRGSL